MKDVNHRVCRSAKKKKNKKTFYIGIILERAEGRKHTSHRFKWVC